MSPALTLPLVGLLISLPGIPGFKKVPKLRMPQKAVVDTLPPVWKPHSLLAVENQFVFAALPPIGPRGPRLKVTNDPRRLQVTVDSDSGTVTTVAELGEVALGNGTRVPMGQFHRDMATMNFRRAWEDRSRQSVNTVVGGSPIGSQRAGGLSFALPIHLPKIYSGILGPGQPAINVSGSENIKLSGTSEWTNQQTGLLGQRRSLFPSLDMEQDLDIRLEGQLSDRVKVNLLQNSATQIPLANKIAINYKGDEDDLVQSLDLGNTNLALPGTQYVSYSGRNEGLFGMKATTRFGPLDFTVLASKQEGKSERASYAGGAVVQRQQLHDIEYVRGTYFFLYDPALETQEIDQTSIQLYLDDGNSYENQHNVVRGQAFVDPRGPLDRPSARGFYTLLAQGADNDFEVLNNIYGPRYKVLRMRRAVTGEYPRLAVVYKYKQVINDVAIEPLLEMGGKDTLDADGELAKTMKLLRAPPILLPPTDATPDAYFRTDTLMAPTRELELRNFYQLAGGGIDPSSFNLTIRQAVGEPPVTFLPGPDGTTIPYLEILGLDNFDETLGAPVFGQHDGKVDGTNPDNTSRFFVDFKNGTLFFYDVRPFAPRIVSDPGYPLNAFDVAVNGLLSRRTTLTGPEDSLGRARNRAIYDKRNPIRGKDSRYILDLEFKADRAGNEINLGRGNIIEGSDAVTINGRRLERDRDYTIDYDLGRVTLKASPGAADQVSVDYSYAPLFQQASRTLLGSAFRLAGRDRHLGGAFMYESKGAQDLRPRLGEEPSRVLIGDLNGEWRTRPEFLTRWVDALPGVRTTAPSEFNVSAEMGASFPNPNTFNKVYIDDMEGVRDAVSLTMTPERWFLPSVPRKYLSPGVADSVDSPNFFPRRRYAEVHWFTPLNAVKERELKPKLEREQGSQNQRQVLALSVPRRPPDPWSAPGDLLWTGLTYPLGGSIDLSRAQFIEVWVNDFRDPIKVGRGPLDSLKLHVDLGTVSEDQRRSPAVPSKDFDTEDLPPRDNQLTVTEGNNEDTGVDGIPNRLETADPSLITSTGDDPAGDDWVDPKGRVDNTNPVNNLDPTRWRGSNGTERNKDRRPVPDTEDLDLSTRLERDNDYFEYTINLVASPYLVEGSASFPGSYDDDEGGSVPPDNGWRRYRIPITDDLRVQFGSPDLGLTKHVRVWIEGIVVADDSLTRSDLQPRPLLMLGGLEIVGSRWLGTELTAGQDLLGTTVGLNAVNTVDNAEIYESPFVPEQRQTGTGTQVQREQSIEVDFKNLVSGDTLEVFKSFSLDENYSRYGTLQFWVANFEASRLDTASGIVTPYRPGIDSLYYFVRFASDERGINYYEYRAPLPNPPSGVRILRSEWSEVKIKLTDLSNLKLDSLTTGRDLLLNPIVAVDPATGVTRVVRGRPSFTRLRRISFGVVNLHSSEVTRDRFSGRVWLDELHATDIARDRGRAQRLGISGRLSNLMGYSFTYDARDEDFLQVGETRGSGNRTSSFAASTNFDLHRFFQGTGIVLPLNFSMSGNRAQPRYSAGDDVVRTGEAAEESESRTDTRTYSASYSRTWSERSNPLLRYSLGGISANISRTTSERSNPTSVDTSRSTSAGVSYTISPRRLLPVPVPGTKFRVWPLPERFFWNYSISTSSIRTYDRLRDGTGSLLLRTATNGRAAGIHFGAATRPFDLLQHQFEARRNLTLPEHLREQIGFINLGKVVSWNQSFSSRYSVSRGAWIRPQLNWNSSYFQNNGPELSPDLSVRAVNNAQAFTVAWTLPFDQLGARTRTARPDTTRRAPPAWHGWLSRLGAVSVDAGFTRNSSFSRLTGTPRLTYLTGLSDDPGLTGRVREVFGNSITLSDNWRTGGRTRLLLLKGASVQTNAELVVNRTVSNAVVNRLRRIQYPTLDVDYGKLPEVLGLKTLLVNPKIRTVFSRNRSTTYANSATPTNISTSTEWRPLVGLTGDFKNGTRAELRVQHRGTETEYRQAGSSTTTDANSDVDLSLTRSYTRGQKVTVLGKQSTVRTNISLGLTGAYSRRKGETRQAGFDRPSNAVSEDRLNVNARGSYGFSNNVTGNAEVGFSQTRDKLTEIVRRSVRLELRAQFTF